MTVANGLQPHPSASRNTGPILDVLRRFLSPPAFTGIHVLEIAAGSGFHAAAFAAGLPHLKWQPSDADAAARASITTQVEHAGLTNLAPPLALDVLQEIWPVSAADAVVCINMTHISPWAATLDLFRGAERLRAGTIVTYGAYSIVGDYLAKSNITFDQSLKQRNPAWGIRDVNDVAGAARDRGFRLVETVRMPANNLTLVFRA